MHTLQRSLRLPRTHHIWLVWLVGMCGLHAAHARAQHQPLFSFQAPAGARPSSVLRTSDGQVYGSAREGGAYGRGSVYVLGDDAKPQTLHSFDGQGDGAAPTSLAEGSDGAVYGLSTLSGEATGRVALFRLDRDGSFQVLRDMQGTPETVVLARGLDGRLYGSNIAASLVFEVQPSGALLPLIMFDQGVGANTLAAAADGTLYGTTLSSAGTASQVFRVSMDGTTASLAQLAAAGEGTAAEVPTTLALTESGVLYVGVRQSEHGVVYRLADGGALEVLADVPSPVTKLAAAPGDVVYGLTAAGGEHAQGQLFRIAADGGMSDVHVFEGKADGASPTSLAVSGDTLYGTTDGAGAGFGTVYQLEGDQLRTLYAFNYPNGVKPSSLVRGSDGSLYGTAREGGEHGAGTVFRASTDGAFDTLHTFDNSDGAAPSSLIEGSDGQFYGRTTRGGEAGFGTLFRMDPSGGLTTLVSFDTEGQGAGPALVQASDGNIYGVDQAESGHIFRITSEGTYEVVYTFGGLSTRDGAMPSSLVEAEDGNLYGTTLGAFGPLIPSEFSSGTIFQLTPDGAFTTLYAFGDNNNEQGASPRSLVLGDDGELYGTTSNLNFVCGVYGGVFKLGRASGELEVLYQFTGGADGTGPADLVEAAPGAFYGVTLGGVGPVANSEAPSIVASADDSNACETRNSTLFEYSGGHFMTRESLSYVISDGARGADVAHSASLINGGNGKLYGVVANGGTNATGELFAYDMVAAGPIPD
ncbi:MAG: choice-of-anchor tandem repeat GloVer-containing protein [Polyangiales bacterium]